MSVIQLQHPSQKIPAIKTPQALIHIKHRISLLQYKYWILLLRELREQFDAGVQPDEDGFRFIPMAKIANALGYTPNKSEVFKDFVALKNETIAFNVLEKDGQEAKYGAGFISEWKVTNHRISFRFPSFLESVVRGLEEPKAMFQLLNWSVFNHFSGKYEAILYKLCRDYVGVGKTPYMTVADFREYMGLKANEYSSFKDLNRNVISYPCKQINENDASEILVAVELEKQKRVVVGLRFYVRYKTQTSMPFDGEESNPAFRFAKVHIEAHTQREYLALRAPDEIELCVERANEYAETQEKAGKPTNLGALYRKAINEGWHVQYAEKKAKTKAIEARKKKAIAAETERQVKVRDENAEYARQVAIILSKFDALDESIKKELRAKYVESLPIESMKKNFQVNGEHSPVHRVNFAKFIESTWLNSRAANGY